MVGLKARPPPLPRPPARAHTDLSSSKSQAIVVRSVNESKGLWSAVTRGNGVRVSPTPPAEGFAPSACERIIIVGAGGFGREVLQWARHAWPEHVGKIGGFLSDNPHALDGHAATLPILGTPDDFEPRLGDRLVLAIGIRGVRRQVAERLAARGARFLTLIHPTAIVADTAVIGAGTVICPYAVVSDAVRLGRFVLVNYHASLGHDAEAGDFAVLSPYATLGGYAAVGADVFLGMHAAVGPETRVGDRSVVAANSCALANVAEATLVHGVPGRSGPLLSLDD
jgi:sugar O-acyltransferase (sialic acid O-acetyltransferase NeuD family)